MNTSVGIVGLGIMGGAIARHLVTGGVRVFGFDTNSFACERARGAGVCVTPNLEEMANNCELIFTSLPTFSAGKVTLDEFGASNSRPMTFVELSTFSIEEKLSLRNSVESKGHVLLDCPLSGTGAQAQTGDLVVYASGSTSAIERCQPIFSLFSKKCFDLGPFGNGSKMKFIANFLVAINNVATAEALVLAMKAGLDPKQVVEVIGAGAGTSKIFEMRGPLMARNEYEPPTMQLGTWFKDMDVIDDFAHKLRVPTPVFDSTKAIYAAADSMGYGDLDTASVCRVLEQMAGIVR